ncbi:MAG: hypothetical protein PHV82_15705, partial [Victivallaceae bacterium]|nr:hypothetical protein [Victivallaceae bacterium]
RSSDLELGSYNTQQHWVTHSGGLFLVYTRRGAGNVHIARNRAPLFMARVETENGAPHVIRKTEKILMPNLGAQYGNGGALNASATESWVVDSEYMKGDSKNPDDIELTVKRGANNRIYLCRIKWDKPNRLVAW